MERHQIGDIVLRMTDGESQTMRGGNVGVAAGSSSRKLLGWDPSLPIDIYTDYIYLIDIYLYIHTD